MQPVSLFYRVNNHHGRFGSIGHMRPSGEESQQHTQTQQNILCRYVLVLYKSCPLVTCHGTIQKLSSGDMSWYYTKVCPLVTCLGTIQKLPSGDMSLVLYKCCPLVTCLGTIQKLPSGDMYWYYTNVALW